MVSHVNLDHPNAQDEFGEDRRTSNFSPNKKPLCLLIFTKFTLCIKENTMLSFPCYAMLYYSMSQLQSVMGVHVVLSYVSLDHLTAKTEFGEHLRALRSFIRLWSRIEV